MTLGDYNRSISYALEAADLYEPFSRERQQNMLMYAGIGYSTWENDKKAIFYFQRARPLFCQSVAITALIE